MWNATPPTEQGWYWAREKNYPDTEGIVRFQPPFNPDPIRPHGSVMLSGSNDLLNPRQFEWGLKVPKLGSYVSSMDDLMTLRRNKPRTPPDNDVSYDGWASSMVASVRGVDLFDDAESERARKHIASNFKRAHRNGRDGWPMAKDPLPVDQGKDLDGLAGELNRSLLGVHASDRSREMLRGALVVAYQEGRTMEMIHNAAVADAVIPADELEDAAAQMRRDKLGPNGECPHCGEVDCVCQGDGS